MKFKFNLLFILIYFGMYAQEPVYNFPIENSIVEDTLTYYELTIASYPKTSEYIYVDKYGGWLEIVNSASNTNLKIKAKDQKGNVYTIDENSGRVLYVNKFYGIGKMPCPTTISKPSYKEVVNNHYATTSDGKIILTKDRGGNLKRTVAYTSKSKVATGYIEEVCPYCKGTGFRESNHQIVKSGRIKRVGFEKYLKNWKEERQLYEEGKSDYIWSGKVKIEEKAEEFIRYYNNIDTSYKEDDLKRYMIQLQYEWIQIASLDSSISYAYYNILEYLYNKNPNIALQFFNYIHSSEIEEVKEQLSMRNQEKMKYFFLNGTNEGFIPLKSNLTTVKSIDKSTGNKALSTEAKAYMEIYKTNPNGLKNYLQNLHKSWEEKGSSTSDINVKYIDMYQELYAKDKASAFELLMKLPFKWKEPHLKTITTFLTDEQKAYNRQKAQEIQKKYSNSYYLKTN